MQAQATKRLGLLAWWMLKLVRLHSLEMFSHKSKYADLECPTVFAPRRKTEIEVSLVSCTNWAGLAM